MSLTIHGTPNGPRGPSTAPCLVREDHVRLVDKSCTELCLRLINRININYICDLKKLGYKDKLPHLTGSKHPP